MNAFKLPFIRTYVLLTFFVSLFGATKLLLVHKIGHIQEIQAASLKKTVVDKRVSIRSSKNINQLSINASQKPFVASENSMNSNPARITTKSKLETSLLPESISDTLKSSSSNSLVNNAEQSKPKETKVDVFKDTPEDVLQELSAEFSDNLVKKESYVDSFQELPLTPESLMYERPEIPAARNNYSYQSDLAIQAELRLKSNVTYDGSYVRIGYPMGDVPSNIGVCTDVVIRALRGLGIDLQQRVHEDMKRNFRSYPNNWQLKRPDSNIDHRRVPNLMTYFKRKGASLRVTNNPADYQPGDIVTWDLNNGMTHIGIGVGPEMTDMLFKHRITGHYNYGSFQHSEGFVSN